MWLESITIYHFIVHFACNTGSNRYTWHDPAVSLKFIEVQFWCKCKIKGFASYGGELRREGLLLPEEEWEVLGACRSILEDKSDD